ncbi:MAG: helix-turn-helix domain-containing protein [Caldimonas sp.]
MTVVAFDRISPFHLAVPCAVFGEDRSEGGLVPKFDFRVCAQTPGELLVTTAGFCVTARYGLEALTDADLIIVPSWRDTSEVPSSTLLEALRAAHARGATLVGLCLGAFVLAATGLLDGRAATTHWAWSEDFAKRFPRVQLDADVLYVDCGSDRLLTSAGTAAGLDCCLHLLRRACGAKAANHVARRLVVPPHRQGGQAQYIEQPLSSTLRGDRLAPILDWLRENLQQAHSLDSLARRALMSRRTFTRHFHESTGHTVGAWLLSQRLALAQELLERTDESIEVIAEQAGFGTSASLRQKFAQAFRISPSAWRREFRGVAAES